MERIAGRREQNGEGEQVESLDVQVDPPWWAERWISLALGLLTGFLAGGLVSYFGFHPTRKNPAPAWSIAGPLVVSLGLWQLWPRPARVCRLSLDDGGLTLLRTDGSSERIGAGDVRMVAARRGLSLDGGEVLPVRRIRVVTAERERTLKLRSGCAMAALQGLSAVCTTAIVLPREGPPLVPPALVELDAVGAIESARVLVRDELGRQFRWTAALAGAILAAAAVLTALVVGASSSGGARGGSVGKAMAHITVGVVVGLVAGVQAAKTHLRARRTDRELRASVEEHARRGSGMSRQVAA